MMSRRHQKIKSLNGSTKGGCRKRKRPNGKRTENRLDEVESQIQSLNLCLQWESFSDEDWWGSFYRDDGGSEYQ